MDYGIITLKSTPIGGIIMKRLISMLLSLCIVAGVMPAIPQYAPESVITANSADEVKTDLEGNKYYEVVDGDLLYWVYSDHALVRSNYEGSAVDEYGDEYIIKASGDIVIPSEFRGVPVTGVFGFGGAQELTSITLPDTVTQIDNYAFYNCTSLETINFSESVKNVGYYAFVGTAWLENKLKESPLVILNGVLVDGHKCEGEVVIPDNVTRIADRAFMDCESIESVSIPDSVEYIGRQAFYNTGWLNKLSAENELVIVNDFLLNGNNCGEDLVIPDTVKSINGQSLAFVENLKSVTIPETVKHIGPVAFYMCPKLESVTILSPDCEIESYIAFSNGRREESGDVYFNGTIYAYAGSTAQTYAEKYGYKFEPLPGYSILKGDANIDGYANIADAVLVMQVATNPDKYAQGKSELSISAQGEKNADVDGKAGLTNEDALLIQQFKLGLINKF